MRRLLILLVLAIVGAACTPGPEAASELGTGSTTLQESDVFAVAASIGRGLNLGNALEAPNEGDWGIVLEEWHFQEIAAGGFDSIRVPIKWSGHAATNAPFTVDEDFFQRIDWVLDQADANGLVAVVNMHHYDEIFDDVDANRDRFLGIWRQIAERYADRSDDVVFELLNEPHFALDAAEWNTLLAQGLDVVRESNPDRAVVIGPHFWNAAWEIETLELPADDRNIIVTFHFYSPFEFTHQGAEWVDGSDAWLGTTWTGTPDEQADVRSNFDGVAAYATREDRPVLLGEFGAYEPADDTSRNAWTAFIRQEAEARGFAWTYWEFGAGFGAYDRTARAWIDPIYSALMPTGGGDPTGFADVPDGHPFAAEIEWLAAQGITEGCDVSRFCPDDAVTRGQMASFLVRALGLVVGSGADSFVDDDGSVHEENIDRLAAAAITEGCDVSRFCPEDPVTRGQMAAFLFRSLAEPV